MAETSRSLLLQSVKELLSSGDYSDFNVICGSDTYHAHRSIVCPRSEFFAAATRFPGEEYEQKKVDLSEEEPAVVKLLMQYLYEGDYSPFLWEDALGSESPTSRQPWMFPHNCYDYYRPQGEDCEMRLCPHHTCNIHCNKDGEEPCFKFACPECSFSFLVIHAKVYSIADRLIVTGLKTLAQSKFQDACIYSWSTSKFPTAVEYVLTSTPDEDTGLMDVVCKTISTNMELMKNATIKKLLMEHNGFAYRLLVEKATTSRWI